MMLPEKKVLKTSFIYNLKRHANKKSIYIF